MYFIYHLSLKPKFNITTNQLTNRQHEFNRKSSKNSIRL
jgi:hypothetical protein